MDLDEDRIISLSVGSELKLPNITFKYDNTVEVGFSATCKIQEIAMARFHEENVRIGQIHVTFWDGSEGYRFAYYGNEGQEHVLVEISDRWIDPHFLNFWLWLPDSRKRRQYPIDELIREELVKDAIENEQKFAEILVAPCKIRIRTVETDPKTFLFEPDLLQRFIVMAKEDPCVKFWESFKKKDYEQAASYIGKVRRLSKSKGLVKQTIFLGAVQALCYLQAGQNTTAINQFVKMGTDFHAVNLDSYSNLCFFFAIDAAKKIEDLNQCNAAMKKIVRKIPNLTKDVQREILDILLSYAVSVYLGSVVLCRRVLELTLTKLLFEKYKMSIPALIKECRKTGVLKGGIRPDLFGILMVAKSKGVLTSSEFEIASHIKDFGNRIHPPSRVKNAVDAKYAIQACIHIMRRLHQKCLFEKVNQQHQ